MKLVIIFGPQAVGKMTVGEELEKLTGLKLFHNHMTIELVTRFFDFDSISGRKLIGSFRKQIFEEVAKSDLEGLIFTYVWAMDSKKDWEYVKSVCEIFESNGGTAYLVELYADLSERIQRNRSEHRLEMKPSKRNLEWSENNLLDGLKKHRLNSFDGEIKFENYIKIDNTNLNASKVAAIIRDKFNL